MNTCKDSIKIYEGSKSQKIAQMITDKLEKKERAKLPELTKDKQLRDIKESMKIAKITWENLVKNLKKREKQLGIEEDYHGRGYHLRTKCRVPPRINFLLQKASDLFSIGNKKESRKIWDSILEKYKLG